MPIRKCINFIERIGQRQHTYTVGLRKRYWLWYRAKAKAPITTNPERKVLDLVITANGFAEATDTLDRQLNSFRLKEIENFEKILTKTKSLPSLVLASRSKRPEVTVLKVQIWH